MRLLLVSLAVLASVAMIAPRSAPVTLLITNARVWTGNPAQPWAEAVAVSADKIVAVGTTANLRSLAATASRVIDAKGGMVTPGFIDSHVHFMGGGFGLSSVKLRDANTRALFIARIKAFALTVPKGAWITGGDWDHSLWGGPLPERSWIDSVTPNNPVWVSRTDGHMALANSLALQAGKVTRDTKDPEGGRIIRDASGEPTGILKDNAQSLVDDVIPDPPPQLADRALDAAMHYVASNGVTSVHNMGYSWWDLEVFERAHKAGRLITRIYAVAPLRTWAQLRDTVAARGRGDDWLHIGGLKGFVDGSAGSHTALMLRPFADAPNDSGLWVTPPESLYAWTAAADKAGLQVMVHAIGDRAIRTQLDIYARVAKENGPRDRRFRIEHAQHPDSAEIPRFAELGVIASMQPYHAIDDGRWMDSVIGPARTKFTYAFRDLLDTKAHLAFGSDWSVAPATPLEGIYAATTRRTLDGKHPDGWVPAQKITVEEALRAYTSGAAYAEFKEWDKGTIEVGKLADLVVLDCDLTAVNPATIGNARVMATIVGGKVVYEFSPGPFIAYEEWQVQQPALARPGNPYPAYPRMLEQARVEGSIRVRFVVDSLGQVDMSTFQVLKTTNELFTKSLLAVLPRMKFAPAQLDGHAVPQWVILPIEFQVHH